MEIFNNLSYDESLSDIGLFEFNYGKEVFQSLPQPFSSPPPCEQVDNHQHYEESCKNYSQSYQEVENFAQPSSSSYGAHSPIFQNEDYCNNFSQSGSATYSPPHQLPNRDLLSQSLSLYSNPNSCLSNLTLPTPPQSPPSSDFEFQTELNQIIDSYPEILDYKPSIKFPAIKDIVSDLENSPLQSCPSFDKYLNKYKMNNCFTEPEKELPKAIKRDSMWSQNHFLPAKDDQKLKTRTFSESSDENQNQCVYSDEEYENLPDTPCVSDEDVEHFHNKEYVSMEHNYCGRAPSPTSSQGSQSDTDEEIDVVSWYDIPRGVSREHTTTSSTPSLVSSTSTATPPSSKPVTSSAQVKRQLQMVIHESIKKKGRVGRPPKASKVSSAVPASILSLNVMNDSPQKPHIPTHGKPASYTKRMREQHSEVLKTNKRRKTTARDPEDDLEKRCNHNIMERNRRVNLKNLFDDLKMQVPDLMETDKTPKVSVLTKSRDYIKELTLSVSQLEEEHELVRQRHLSLKRKCHALRREFQEGNQ